MKYLISLLFPALLFAQKTKTQPDTICFTREQAADISFMLDSLWAADDVNNELITAYRKLTHEQDSLIKLDLVQLAAKDKQIELQNDIIKNYEQMQPKFMDKKVVWFGFGFLAALGTGILINQAIK